MSGLEIWTLSSLWACFLIYKMKGLTYVSVSQTGVKQIYILNTTAKPTALLITKLYQTKRRKTINSTTFIGDPQNSLLQCPENIPSDIEKYAGAGLLQLF